jgi:hypothetical protein
LRPTTEPGSVANANGCKKLNTQVPSLTKEDYDQLEQCATGRRLNYAVSPAALPTQYIIGVVQATVCQRKQRRRFGKELRILMACATSARLRQKPFAPAVAS